MLRDWIIRIKLVMGVSPMCETLKVVGRTTVYLFLDTAVQGILIAYYVHLDVFTHPFD